LSGQSAGSAPTNGTAEVECEVIGLPSGVSIVSALPWSARMKRATPACGDGGKLSCHASQGGGRRCGG
jgi:hypothetical protein